MQLDFPLRLTYMLHNNPSPENKQIATTKYAVSGHAFSRDDLLVKASTDEGWEEIKKRIRLEFNTFLESLRAELLNNSNITTEGRPLPDSAMLRGLANLIDAGKRIVISVAAQTDDQGTHRLEVILKNPLAPA